MIGEGPGLPGPNLPNLSDIAEQAEALASQGEVSNAIELLVAASGRGEPDADFKLGQWLLSGTYLVRRLSLAREAFRRAADAGHEGARHVHIAFMVTGTGAEPNLMEALRLLTIAAATDPLSALQLDLIRRMEIDVEGAPQATRFQPQPISDGIQVVRGIFSEAECMYLIQAARPLLEPSLVLDPTTGKARPDPIRTADAAAFPLALEDPVIHLLNRRLAAVTSTSVRQGEPLQVLRYRSGQQFRPHVDTLPQTSNQRVLTALIALNQGYEGGETVFIKRNIAWRGCAGDALIFRNIMPSGFSDASMIHAGRLITAGEKMLASRWIRARPIDLHDGR